MLNISDEDRQILAVGRFEHPHPRVQRKMEAVYLTSMGVSRREVARLVQRTGRTVRSYMAEAERLGITLLWLPTYSPNFNLIERLWKFVRAECLHGRYYATFAPFKQAIIDCLEDPEGRHKAKLATLLTLKFRLFNEAA